MFYLLQEKLLNLPLFSLMQGYEGNNDVQYLKWDSIENIAFLNFQAWIDRYFDPQQGRNLS